MRKPFFTVKELVQITGVTTRTLHYYDKIGLLKPNRQADNGYRIYSVDNVNTLQTILFFKEIDFSLQDIAAMLQLSKQEQLQQLKKQKQALQSKRRRLDTIITALDEYESGTDIVHLKLFEESNLTPLHEQYAEEARIRYGETTHYKSYMQRVKARTEAKQAAVDPDLESKMENVFHSLAAHMHKLPASKEVQRLIEEWKWCLDQTMVCDKEILVCIADVYRTDRRFRDYLSRYSDGDEGFSDYIYEAVIYYCDF